MPQIVEIPEIGEVEFPDDFTPDRMKTEVQGILAKRMPPAEPLPEDIPLTDSGPAPTPGVITGSLSGSTPVPPPQEIPTLSPEDPRFPAAQQAVDVARSGLDAFLIPAKVDFSGAVPAQERERQVRIAQAEYELAAQQPTDPTNVEQNANLRALKQRAESLTEQDAKWRQQEAPPEPESYGAWLRRTGQEPGVIGTFLESIYKGTTEMGVSLASSIAPSMGEFGRQAVSDLSQRVRDSEEFVQSNEGIGGKIGRGAGAAANLLLGGGGATGAVLKAAAQTYGSVLSQTGSPTEATSAALETYPTLALYMGVGMAGAKGVNALLPKSLTPMQVGLATGAGGTLVNVGTSAALAALEGREYGIQDLTFDTLMGAYQGAGEYKGKVSENARNSAYAELASRGFEPEQIKSFEFGKKFTTPTDTPAFKVVRSAEPEVMAPTMQAEVDAAQAPAPVVRVLGEEVQGQPGETPHSAVGRAIVENPNLTEAQIAEALAAPVEEIPRNLGPGAANIEEPFQKLPSTSNKEAVVNAERAAENLDPVIKEARISNVDSIDRAETILEQNPKRATEIVQRLRSQPPQERTIALEDGAIMLVDRVRLKNERALNEQRALDENSTPEEREVAKNKVTELSNEIYAMDAAAQGARSTWGRFGQLWQRTMRDDYTLDAMERRFTLSKGSPATPDERARIQKQSEELQKVDEAFEKRKTQLEEEQPVDDAIKAIELEARKNPEFTPEVLSLADRIVSSLDKAAESALKRLRSKFAQTNTGVDPTILVDVAILGASKVAKGLVKFGQWSTAMVRELGDGVKPYLQEAWDMANKNIDDAVRSVRPKDPTKVKAAVTKTKAVATADSIGEKMKERVAAGEKLTDMTGSIRSLVETLVRGGIKERGPLVDAVHEVLKNIDPAITRRQATDAISGYGDFTPLSKDAVKVTVRDLKGQLQQVSKLEDIQAKVPLQKTGGERRTPSTEERNLIQQVNEAKKKYGVVVTDPASQLKSATDAIEKRLENQIKDITREIETGEAAPEKSPAPTNDRIEQLRALRDRVQSTLSEIKGKPTMTDEQRVAMLTKTVNAEIASLERQIKAGEADKRPQKSEVRNAQLDALRARRDALRAEVDSLRVVDEASVEEKKFDATMKAVDALEKKLAADDTAPSSTRKMGPDSEMVTRAKETLAELQKQLQERRKAKNPPKPEEQRKLEASIKAVEKSIQEYDRRLQAGDMEARSTGTKVTSLELESLRAERDAMRALFNDLRKTPPKSEEQRQLENLARSTQKLAERLAAKDTSPSTKRKLGPDSEMVTLAKNNLAELRKQMQELRKAENLPKPEEQRKLESAMKAVEKSIADYDKRLRVGDMAAKVKKAGVTSPELEARRAERDAMRALFKEMQNALKPKRSKEEIALSMLKARLKKDIADKTDRMARGDFTPKPKPPPVDISKDPEAVALKAESDRIKRQYEQDKVKAEFAAQSIGQKTWRVAKETLNLPRAILSSWDLSAVLRQGGLISLGNPVRAARAMGEMFKAVASQKQAELAEARIRSRPNAPLYEESGLYLAPLEEVRIGRQEEQLMSEIASKLPGIKVSNRAFVTFLNRLRADSFDAMVASLERPGVPLTPQEMKAIANYINVATGRGDMGSFSQSAANLSTFFFSPRLLVSRFQTLARPLMGFRQGGETSMRVRKAVAKEYGKLLLGLGTIYGLAKLAGAEVEEDPRSSDFGKLRFGNTRVDPLAGLAQVTTLIGRISTGQTKSLSGRTSDIRGEQKRFGVDDPYAVFTRFLRTKFSPVLGTSVDLFTGRNVVGEKVTPLDAVKNLTIPLGFRDVKAVMEEQGIPKGLVLELLNLFGWGLQQYESR